MPNIFCPHRSNAKAGHTKMRHGFDFDHEKTEGRSLPFSVHAYLAVDKFTQNQFLRLLLQAVHMACPVQWMSGFIRGWVSFQQLRHCPFNLLSRCPVDFRQMRIQLLRQQQMGEGTPPLIFQKRLPQHAILPDSDWFGRCQIRQQIISVHSVRQFHIRSSLRVVYSHCAKRLPVLQFDAAKRGLAASRLPLDCRFRSRGYSSARTTFAAHRRTSRHSTATRRPEKSYSIVILLVSRTPSAE